MDTLLIGFAASVTTSRISPPSEVPLPLWASARSGPASTAGPTVTNRDRPGPREALGLPVERATRGP